MAWTFDEVDRKLKGIMTDIFNNVSEAAKEAGHEDNYVVGANIAGFIRLASVMLQQGIV
jgi:glutamate dehydrogenase (NADP+)